MPPNPPQGTPAQPPAGGAQPGAPAAPAAAAGDGEAGRIQGLDERFSAIEAEQAEQRGILDQIRAAVTGSGGQGQAPAGGTQQPAAPDSGTIAEQMRQAVRDVQAEQAAQAAQAAHDADHARLRQPAPETAPREVMVRGKEKLQRALFGGDRR